jgi:hypothetical protein
VAVVELVVTQALLAVTLVQTLEAEAVELLTTLVATVVERVAQELSSSDTKSEL